MKVAIIAAGLAVRHLAHLITSVESLPNVELTKPKPDLDFYPVRSSKEPAQWKRETRGKRLK